jgi:hypothetical protein
LTNDGSTISWISCGYPDGNNNKLVVRFLYSSKWWSNSFLLYQFKSEGSGGMPEFVAQLPDDDVVWGAFKVVGVDDRGNLVSRRPKFIFVKYLPNGVPTMKRARAGGHKGAIRQV